MADMKDKVKGFMKKVNNPFQSSSSGKFKGQGRVLGSTPSSSIPTISGSNSNKNQYSSSTSLKSDRVLGERPPRNEIPEKKIENLRSNVKESNGFDPFESLITSGKRNTNGYSLNVVECPVCGGGFSTEDEVSDHIGNCLSISESKGNSELEESVGVDDGLMMNSELDSCVGAYLSGMPPERSVEVMLRLLKNVVKEPENGKFRRFKMGNPKIKEAIGDVVGAVELLEYVGFKLKEEDGELCAVMEEVPSEEDLASVKKAIVLLEPERREELKVPSVVPAKVTDLEEIKKIDREIRVFFSTSESTAANIQLSDSFYNLSAEELKRDAERRRKKIEESKLLIPKSYKEKQAKAARKRYNRTKIRIQFPDGVLLQGFFLPSEPTSALYEFVSSSLKEPSLEFELLPPVPRKRRVVPHFPAVGERAVTLEEEDLVPSALVKFLPMETESVVFTGLRNELLEISEPLVPDS